jgi:hypothetical protein
MYNRFASIRPKIFFDFPKNLLNIDPTKKSQRPMQIEKQKLNDRGSTFMPFLSGYFTWKKNSRNKVRNQCTGK